MLFGVAHWVGCAWWWIASCTSPSFDETTWVSQYLKRFPLPSKSDPRELTSDPHDLALHVKLTLALFWGFQAMANLGYSDIVPNNFLEIAFGVICTFIQMNYYAYILGTLFQYVVHKDEEAELYRKRMKGLDAYGRGRHLPLALRTRLKRHFDFMSSKAELKQQKEVMDQLPPSLVAKVAEWEHIDVVTSVQLFAGTPEQFITMLCCKLKLKYLMPGELLFKRGDMSRELVFIQDGVVEVYEDKEQRKILRELSAGVVGELSFFMGIMQPFTMSASDKSDVTLKSLSKDDYEAILENYSEGHAMVASNLCLEYGLDRNGNEIDTIAARAAMSGAKTQEDQPAKSKKSTKKGSKSANAEAGNEDSDDWLALRKMLQAALKKRKDDALAAMIDAASEGDIDEIKRVLHQGLDVNTGDYDSRTMLHLSAAEGNVKVVKALLSEGADVNVTDRWGQMPLHDAIQANHTQVVELLASQGAELEFENAADKLCAAAADGDIESLKALIDHGISPNSADYDGRTALHLAAAEGIVNVLEFLLANKADVNVLDRWNNTPLDDAVKFLHELPARLLFEAGGALNLEYASGALCEAASEGDITRLRLLFENGTDVRVADYDNRTALVRTRSLNMRQ
jgi:hyperpolarization activated cyclic nucleotide-gated potassium channel 4